MAEQNKYDQRQAILIAAVTAVAVFAVLTTGLMAVMAILGPSKEDPLVAKSPSEKRQSPTSSGGATVSTPEPTIPKSPPTTTTPKVTPPPQQGHRRPKHSPPDLSRPEHPPPIAPPIEMPIAQPSSLPDSPPDENEIPSSSFLDGEIIPLNPDFLEPTAEELRAKKADEEAKQAAIAFLAEFTDDEEEHKRLVEELLILHGSETSSWSTASRLLKLKWLKDKGKLTDELEARLREEWGFPSRLPTRPPKSPAHHPKPPSRPAHRH